MLGFVDMDDMELIYIVPAVKMLKGNVCFLFSDDPPRSIYALLVAGSNGFSNYRHQADVAHAYHILIGHGVPADNIVTMMYDDVAHDPKNPQPGELHNSPDGPDYRKGMKVDYRTTSVNKVVFQAVLSGDDVIARAFPGSGRVLRSTKEDNVFIYYTDHGAYNVLGMPNGSPITRSDLAAYIKHARSVGKFHKLSVYIEACESGSMLMGMENDNVVNGLTASNSSENSYACNCAKGICYADLFSYKWMTNSEQHNLLDLSITQQYTEVKSQVKSSTVQMFGSNSITRDPVGYFQGTSSVDVLSRKKEMPESSNRVRAFTSGISHQCN
ncbi:Legumain-protease-precursor [Trichostrongylus colubriformis]|uniref:Legumain-protease-precursor n=1 Tax=Trichostrongylus colubriformis TaxID=6319 RepID=A0AAN8J0T8_TRICO